jgi:uncharacterized oxidoreductase
MTMKISGNTILVTGGSAGIGRGLAAEFHRAGNKVIVAGRNESALDEIAAAHPGMAAMVLDIADGESIPGFVARVVAEHPDLNVVVNNAGIMRFEDKIDLAAVEATIATNLLGPIRLTSALLPHLLAQAEATIINVSSTQAFVPLPFSPTYGATKAALHAWTFALRMQMIGTNVEVIEIIPPAVQTELTPGQSASPIAMPLDDFIAETMELLSGQPTPAEICVERAMPARRVTDDEQVLADLRQYGLAV